VKPSASSTSAEPQAEETARLPCFATAAPAAAATSAAAVEILIVCAHRFGAAGDLRRRLALRAQGDEEAGDLRGRGLAGHDLPHRLGRVLGPEMLPAGEPQQQFRPEIGVRHEVREASSGCVRPSPWGR